MRSNVFFFFFGQDKTVASSMVPKSDFSFIKSTNYPELRVHRQTVQWMSGSFSLDGEGDGVVRT